MSIQTNKRGLYHVLPVILVAFLMINLLFSASIWREVRAIRRSGVISNAESVANASLSGTACPGLKLGVESPSLILQDTEANTVDVSSYKGHFVLLIFSSTKCSACAAQYANWQRFGTLMSDVNDLVVILVSLGTDDENRELRRVHRFEFPVLTATKDVFPNFSLTGTPTFVLIDKDGRAKACLLGASNIESMVEFAELRTHP